MNKSIIPHKTLTEHERKLLSLDARKNAVHLNLLEAVKLTFDTVWADPIAFFSAQGTQGGSNMAQHALAVTYLIQAGVDVPERYRSAPQAYTIHSDGTITLD
jgi:hypothetical protein